MNTNITNEIQIADTQMLSNWCDCSFYRHTEPFELRMKYEDVRACCHQGECDADVEGTRQLDYMRQQLDTITCEQMFGYVMEYVGDDEINPHRDDRDWLETYTVWLSAGTILDEIRSGYLEYRLCDTEVA